MAIRSKVPNDKFRENFDRIFGTKVERGSGEERDRVGEETDTGENQVGEGDGAGEGRLTEHG